MKLTKLPDLLIADIAGRLDHPDICNLKKTSKKIYNAINLYKKDNVKLIYLEFNERSIANEDIPGGVLSLARGHFYKGYSFKGWSKNDTYLDNVKKVLAKCHSVSTLCIHVEVFTKAFYEMILNTKVHIGQLQIFTRSKIDTEEMMILGRKFECKFKFESDEVPEFSENIMMQLLSAVGNHFGCELHKYPGEPAGSPSNYAHYTTHTIDKSFKRIGRYFKIKRKKCGAKSLQWTFEILGALSAESFYKCHSLDDNFPTYLNDSSKAGRRTQIIYQISSDDSYIVFAIFHVDEIEKKFFSDEFPQNNRSIWLTWKEADDQV